MTLFIEIYSCILIECSERVPKWTAFACHQIIRFTAGNDSDRSLAMLAGDNGMIYVWNVFSTISKNEYDDDSVTLESKLLSIVELPVKV